MTDKADNLVEFPADPDAVEITVGFNHGIREVKCRHPVVTFAESESLSSPDGLITRGGRRVYCKKCDETLDAFEVLVRYARVDDKLRRQAKAWRELDAAWSWLWAEKGALSISKAGVSASIEVGGKRRRRKAMAAQRDGLASLIIGAVEALKMMKKWEPRPTR